jgi:hypothetical protein
MKFTLQQKTGGKTGLATFAVLDEKNQVHGTVVVPASASADLIKRWKAEYTPAPKRGPNAMAKTLMANRTKQSKQAILRGC